MIKNNYSVLQGFFIMLLVTGTPCFSQDFKPGIRVEDHWQTSDVLKTTESVCFNQAMNVLYVSCINGNPVDKDGNGYIALLSLTGEVKNLHWVAGLNAPKGMSLFKSKLFVTDIDRVVEIETQNATITNEFRVDGAKFLNDIAIDAKGNLYVSDMATGKIHRIQNGVIETWIDNEEIDSPNGMFYENQEVLVGTKNGIYSIRISDKRVWPKISIQGGIDGLKADGNGNYIISDWYGKIQFINSDKELILLIDTTSEGINAADFEFIPEKKLLLVPTFGDNRLMTYEIIYN